MLQVKFVKDKLTAAFGPFGRVSISNGVVKGTAEDGTTASVADIQAKGFVVGSQKYEDVTIEVIGFEPIAPTKVTKAKAKVASTPKVEGEQAKPTKAAPKTDEEKRAAAAKAKADYRARKKAEAKAETKAEATGKEAQPPAPAPAPPAPTPAPAPIAVPAVESDDDDEPAV